MAADEYDEPGIAIGVKHPKWGFISFASVFYGCTEAKELGEQMELAQRIVDALNSPTPNTTKDIK
jgi:hypothetical protein